VATHFRLLKIKDIRKETADCVSVSFEIPEEWKEEFRFKQGQNITIRTNINDEEIRRSYSICSSPYEQELRIAIKKIPGGRFSSYINNLLEKPSLDILPPTGRFFTSLDPSNKKHYLAFAAGSGITPVISIIKTTLATEPRSHFTLIYGNRDRHSIIFREELEALKNRYMQRFSLHHILSREKTDASINQGRIDEEKCNVLFEKLPGLKNADEIFICGPEAMIFCIKNWLEKNDVDRNKIHFELFTVPGVSTSLNPSFSGPSTSPGAFDPSSGMLSKVTIKLDGISFDFDLLFDGEPILDAALKQGADLPFSCKGGVCATCKAKLISGQVEMDTNYALEPEELNAGFILTCQSHPRSVNVSIDFDQRQ
jgi:ring-1,2-phenylacetyl-CoA epoxidase subunit PaaE